MMVDKKEISRPTPLLFAQSGNSIRGERLVPDIRPFSRASVG
jgi:hypothetical protein